MRAQRRLRATFLGGCCAVVCRLRSATVGPPPLRAWAPGARGREEEAKPPSGGGMVLTRCARGGGP